MGALGFKIQPIPDETVFGLVVIAGVLAGLETYTQCYKTILGVATPSPLTLVPKGFMKFAGLVSSEHQDQSDDALFDHTFIPYYRHFIQFSTLESIQDGLVSDNGAAIRLRPGQLNTLVNGNRFLKTCPACTAEQKQKYHRTTWLRSHNLPGVEVCYRHGLSLRNCKISIDGSEPYSVEISFPECEIYEAGDNLWSRGERWWRQSPRRLIAQVSHELLSEMQCCNDQRAWENVYKRAVLRFTNSSDREVDWQALSAGMRSVYGDLIPKVLGVDFACSGETRHWLKRLLGYDNKIGVQQPILHVLLIGALFGSYSDLKEAITEEAARLDSSNNTLSESNFSGKSEGCSPPGTPVATEQRPRSWIRKRTNHRNAILEMMISESGLTRMQLFERLYAAYRWLSKNDKAWLEETLPGRVVKYGSRPDLSRPRKDWTQMDKQVALVISKVCEDGAFADPIEQKNITLAQIARLAGVKYEKLLQLQEYPETHAVLSGIQPFRSGLEIR